MLTGCKHGLGLSEVKFTCSEKSPVGKNKQSMSRIAKIEMEGASQQKCFVVCANGIALMKDIVCNQFLSKALENSILR